MTPVLALDLATSTGWALRARDGTVTSGVQRFELKRGESPGMRFLRFRRWLAEVIALGELGPAGVGVPAGVIAYETPLTTAKGFASGIGKELAAIALVEAAARGIETTNVAPSSLKKHATGSGRASKDDMVRAAAKRWLAYEDANVDAHVAAGGKVLGEDEADALCVLAWALDEIGEGSGG
jgi:hypothetical protein